MGEEIDLSDMGEEDKEAQRQAPEKLRNMIELEEEIVRLLRSGHSHSEISTKLKRMGFSYYDIEEILSEADTILEKRPEKKTFMDYVFYGVVALLILAILSVILLQVFSYPLECKDDPFCVSKIRNCSPGNFFSAYSGVVVQYSIFKEDGICRVDAEVTDAIEGSLFEPGMSMACTHPIVDGKVDISLQKSQCEGSLATAFGF